MFYIILNPDNSLLDTSRLPIDGGIEIDEDPVIFRQTPYGFTVWDYINNSLVLNDARHEAAQLLPLADEVALAKTMVDNSAGLARKRYITDVPGQGLTYQEKADEATDYVAASYPVDLTSYPFIQAEVNATSKTSTQAADDILTQRSAWITVGASIEEERIGGKVNVDAAADNAEVISARDAAIAALDLI